MFSSVTHQLTHTFNATMKLYSADLTGSGEVVDEDDKLHPALPLICLVSVQHTRLKHTRYCYYYVAIIAAHTSETYTLLLLLRGNHCSTHV